MAERKLRRPSKKEVAFRAGSVALLAATCAGPGKDIQPTINTDPGSTPTPIVEMFTPTPEAPTPSIPTIEVDGLKLPDPKISNPELFDITKPDSPIVQFANAFGVTPEQVGELTPEVKTAADGSQFAVLTTADLPQTADFDESGTPLMIAEQGENGEWNWSEATPGRIGTSMGIDVDVNVLNGYLQSWSPESTNMNNIVRNFNGALINYDLAMYNGQYPELSVRPDKETFNLKGVNEVIRTLQSINSSIKIDAQPALEFVNTFIPPWFKEAGNQVKNGTMTREEFISNMNVHVEKLAQKLDGKVDSWVVFGELFNQYTPNFWVNTLGVQDVTWIKNLYDIVRSEAPNIPLYYSDFDIEFGGEKANQTYKILEELVRQGTPIDGIAFQMHLNGVDLDTTTELDSNINALKEQVRKYRDLGLEVIVGEMDINMLGVSNDPFERAIKQAEITDKIILALLEEGVSEFRFFTQIDRLNWKEDPNFGGGKDADPSLFNDGGLPKPAYFSLMSSLLIGKK